MLFGRRQNALQADHEQVAEQMGVDVLGSPAHEILLEATDSVANRGFDFTLRLHGDHDPMQLEFHAIHCQLAAARYNVAIASSDD
jgi:hypothetical protein